MLLFNTQQDLENPFDMNGMDDVFFDMDREMDDAWQPLASMAGEAHRAPAWCGVCWEAIYCCTV
jgi:hypothetical protein